MEKFIYYNNLFIIYKDLLTVKNKEIFSYYYEDNLSLQEIGNMLNVSKSYVGHVIKTCEKKLNDLESKLKIYHNKQKLNALLEYDNIIKIKEELKKILDF